MPAVLIGCVLRVWAWGMSHLNLELMRRLSVCTGIGSHQGVTLCRRTRRVAIGYHHRDLPPSGILHLLIAT